MDSALVPLYKIDKSYGTTKYSASLVRFRYFLLVLSVFVGSFFILNFYEASERLPFLLDSLNEDQDKLLQYTIQTEGCSIPHLEPLDESIKKFVAYPNKMKPCPIHYLLDKNRTHIWVRNEDKAYFNITNGVTVKCCYRSFYRSNDVTDITSSRIDDRVTYNDCVYFSKAIEVKHEFVRVSCSVSKVQVYEQFFLFTPKKQFLVHEDVEEIPQNKSAYNILLLGIDGVSRMNLHRTMPKTVAYLKDLGVIELLGYNKVGDNTFPNLIPMLLGHKESEIKTTCLPTRRSTFDNCPFVWEWYKQAGYYTAMAEDSGSLGTFNYLRRGFATTPFDYYLHTFINEAEKNVGTNKDFNCNLCMNERRFYKVLLDYLEDLTITLKANRLFGFFWETTMSHDDVNYPMIMDDDYKAFFKRLNASRYLDDTIVFLVSDHGIRWGDLRSTPQGRIEERLPFVFVLTPTSFKENYSEAYNHLKTNRFRLTTPFDLHETLLDLIDLDQVRNNMIEVRSKESYSAKQGISLFLPVPGNRTCGVAGIDAHWCTCRRAVPLARDSALALEVGAQLVRSLNALLRAHAACAPLALAHVAAASELLPGDSSAANEDWHELTVVVRTEPGDAVFEATLRHRADGWQLAGSVSRLNLYADQSRCVHDFQLKLYCYCL